MKIVNARGLQQPWPDNQMWHRHVWLVQTSLIY
jgi:hypothetical protein